jgi:hypothetical protein
MQERAQARIAKAAAKHEDWETLLSDTVFVEAQITHREANDIMAQFVLNTLELAVKTDLQLVGPTYNFPTDDISINPKTQKVIRCSFVTSRYDPPQGAHLQFWNSCLGSAELICPQDRLDALQEDRLCVSGDFKHHSHYVPIVVHTYRPLDQAPASFASSQALIALYISSWTWNTPLQSDGASASMSAPPVFSYA